jgi:hypothetical protein
VGDRLQNTQRLITSNLGYYIRGVARSEMGAHKGAITDLQKAAQLFKQQGNTELYQKTLQFIRKLQQ